MSSRDQFETWAEKNGHDIYRSGIDGAYYFQSTQWSWDIWQAATNAMEAKCAALEADNEKAMEAMRQADAVVKRAHEEYAEMAAENEAMKSAIDATIGWQQSTDAENVESVRMLVGIKTPSIDAFLAEVRASTADEVCLKISNAIINCYQDEQVGLDAAATICGDFASQLRKGASA